MLIYSKGLKIIILPKLITSSTHSSTNSSPVLVTPGKGRDGSFSKSYIFSILNRITSSTQTRFYVLYLPIRMIYTIMSWLVNFNMFCARYNQKILNSVVISNSIYMMYKLFFAEISFEVFFHHNSMRKHFYPLGGMKLNIATCANMTKRIINFNFPINNRYFDSFFSHATSVLNLFINVNTRKEESFQLASS